jgi:tRNA dimethylallyltransferase
MEKRIRQWAAPGSEHRQAMDLTVDTCPPIVCIVGPTAVGKSRLALALAEQFDAEIISADSRQVYRYMDIGTDKPLQSERARVPHHMIDVVAPNDHYSVQRFAAEGRTVLRRLLARGRPAIVAGGTGFYVRSLLDAPSLPAVEPDAELRARLYREAEELGADVLHAGLAERDPVSAARIHPRNLPRVVRALEIVETTGRPVPPPAPGDALPALRIGLEMDRSRLRNIIDERVHRQMRAGLVDETRVLLAMGYDSSLPALQGFGYRQMVQYLHGEFPLDVAVDRYKTATHQYVRRQLTWFRADQRIEWLPVGVDLEARAEHLARSWIEQ